MEVSPLRKGINELTEVVPNYAKHTGFYSKDDT